MISIVIKLESINSPNDFTVWYKKSDSVGDFVNGFTQYGGIFSGNTSSIDITLNLDESDFGKQYWIKLDDETNDSFIIENINIHSLEYFYNFCTPEPSATPTPTPTPTPNPTPSITPTNGATPTPTPDASPNPTPTMTVTPTSTPLVPVSSTPTPTPTMTPTPTQTPPPVGYEYYRFVRCIDSSYCYMPIDTYNFYVGQYGISYFQTGNRYYGAIEGDPNYLYLFNNTLVVLYDTPSCVLTGVSSTNHSCP